MVVDRSAEACNSGSNAIVGALRVRDNAIASFSGHKRYLGQTAEQLEQFRATAQSYPGLLSMSEALGLFTKPFDRSCGHASFFFPMFHVLNMLRVLQLEAGARNHGGRLRTGVGNRDSGRSRI